VLICVSICGYRKEKPLGVRIARYDPIQRRYGEEIHKQLDEKKVEQLTAALAALGLYCIVEVVSVKILCGTL
jgi:hypothetical protein